MRKKFLIVIGSVILFVLPLFVSAQFPEAEMSDCCELEHTIETGVYDEDDVVGAGAVGVACNSQGQTLNIDVSTADWGGVCTMDTVYTITDFVFWLFFAVAIIFGIIAGFMFMSAGGNPQQLDKAKSMFTYLVIGIVVAVAVRLIPSLARAIIGV